MKIPATAAVVGLAMWVGLAAVSAAMSTPPMRALTVTHEWGTRAMAAHTAGTRLVTRGGE